MLVEVGKPATNTERKAHWEEQKRVVKAHSSSNDSDKEEITKDQVDVPSAFKRYTIYFRTILLQKPKQQKLQLAPGPGPDKAQRQAKVHKLPQLPLTRQGARGGRARVCGF